MDTCLLMWPGSVADLRRKVAVEHEQVKNKEQTPKASYGYGGRFGVEEDRMDKVGTKQTVTWVHILDPLLTQAHCFGARRRVSSGRCGTWLRRRRGAALLSERCSSRVRWEIRCPERSRGQGERTRWLHPPAASEHLWPRRIRILFTLCSTMFLFQCHVKPLNPNPVSLCLCSRRWVLSTKVKCNNMRLRKVGLTQKTNVLPTRRVSSRTFLTI